MYKTADVLCKDQCSNCWRRKAEGTGREWDSRIFAIIWWQKQSYWNLYSLMWSLAFKIIWVRLASSVVSFLTYRLIRSIPLLWNDHDEYILNSIFPTASSVQSLEAPKSRGVEIQFNSHVFSSIICLSIRGNYSAKSWWLACKFTCESVFLSPSALEPQSCSASWVESHKRPICPNACSPGSLWMAWILTLLWTLPFGLTPPAFPGPHIQLNHMLISLAGTLNLNNAVKSTLHLYFSPGSFWNSSLLQIYESVGLALLGEKLSW